MKHVKKFAVVGVMLLLFYPFEIPGTARHQESEPEPAELTLAAVDELISEITIENCEKAIKGYKLLLKDSPKDYEILYKLANAYIYIIDIKTSALIEEKDEFKPILKEVGKIANDYAQKAYEINPKGKEAIAANLVSYGYYSASFGIFKAIFKGAAGHYKDLSKQLIEVDDTYLGALGYRMLGELYHVAPWPVGSKSKALKFFKKAIETDNTVLYSHYYAGLIYFEKDQYDLAKKEFKFVAENPPSSHETHYIDAYKERARDYLKKIDKIRGKQ